MERASAISLGILTAILPPRLKVLRLNKSTSLSCSFSSIHSSLHCGQTSTGDIKRLVVGTTREPKGEWIRSLTLLEKNG
ncbi:MAG: hypothetical protein PHH85_00295 [Candidatus Methanoperedens sp.]|nr:hypothetical protein [Candidatus Methanoperedens sp.]